MSLEDVIRCRIP